MGFGEFLVLLIVSVIVSAVLHYGLQYYVMSGTRSFCGKIVLGYLGALYAGPLIGTWDLGVRVADVAVIPAIVGSLGMIVFAVDILETAYGRKG